MGGVYHHAINSHRVYDFDVAYPSHPGKILAAPLATKGVLTDDDVLFQYIYQPRKVEFDLRRRLHEQGYDPGSSGLFTPVDYIHQVAANLGKPSHPYHPVEKNASK